MVRERIRQGSLLKITEGFRPVANCIIESVNFFPRSQGQPGNASHETPAS